MLEFSTFLKKTTVPKMVVFFVFIALFLLDLFWVLHGFCGQDLISRRDISLALQIGEQCGKIYVI
jgi:hypothetical protein